MSGKVPGTLLSIIFADCFLSCRPRLSNELTMGTFLNSLDKLIPAVSEARAAGKLKQPVHTNFR